MYRAPKAAITASVSCAIFFFLFFAAGCGSSNTNAHIRLANAAPISANNIDLVIDGKNAISNVGYASASGYVSVSPGSRQLQWEASGTSSPFGTMTSSISGGSSNTVLAAPGPSASGLYIFTDNNKAPSSGNISVRAINAVDPAITGSVDVYIVSPGTDVNTVSAATFSSVGNHSASGYSTLAAGSYQVIFTQAGTKTIVYETGTLSFTSGQIRTVMALDGQGGGITAAVLSDLN